jgi:murein DD-endopeptidase MepM/ murein hydrolase activator NlpD
MQKFLFGVIVTVLVWGCYPEKKAQKVEKELTPEESDSTVSHTYDNFGLKVDSLEVEQHNVKRNENFYLILDKFDFSSQEIYSVTQQARDLIDIQSIKPGQKYRTYASADSNAAIRHMVWQPNPIEYVVFDWQHDSLEIYKAARPLTKKTVHVSGTINNSLYQTVSNVDASPLLAYKMAEIFAWQINFFGLREGDSFNVLYDKQYIDDEFYGIGEIKAAEFTHRGDRYRAYQFNHSELSGYFTETGESVQKALLKAPFKYSQRISSHYSHNRYHPTLKKRMPHYGVDFAAPPGTPVLSVGDGTVTKAGYSGANGNMVKVTHNGTYRTAYLHLQGFANGIHSGAKVKQGQVIGFVGSTGRSTGPHLHYSLYKNDRPVNPRTIELPSSESIPDSLMTEFEKVRDSFDEQLETAEDSIKKVSPNPVVLQAK